MIGLKHLWWIVAGMLVGFMSSFIFADLLALPLDFYYFVYFLIVITLFTTYIKVTLPDIKAIFKKRWIWGLMLGLLFGALMLQNVLSRPETQKLTGVMLVWALIWRGLIYGAIDGLLLTVFPWLVTWRALHAEEKSLAQKIAAAFLAWIFIIFTTSAYHVGYADFRSAKTVQANIGNTIMSIPTLASANPLGTPITHAILHVTAVLRSPHTDLFLPPHRDSANASMIGVPFVSVEKLKRMMQVDDLTLINVHVPYAGEINETDLFIPYNEISNYREKLPRKKDTKIVLYCRTHNMSSIAFEQLLSLGYRNVYVLRGGMRSWENFEFLDNSEMFINQ